MLLLPQSVVNKKYALINVEFTSQGKMLPVPLHLVRDEADTATDSQVEKFQPLEVTTYQDPIVSTKPENQH